MAAMDDFDVCDSTFAPGFSSTTNFSQLTRMASTPFHQPTSAQPQALPEPGVSFIKPQLPVLREERDDAVESSATSHDNINRSFSPLIHSSHLLNKQKHVVLFMFWL